MISTFITFLADLDSDLLLALNGMHTPWLDGVMMFITKKWLWIGLSSLMAIAVFRAGGAKRGFMCIIGLAVALAISDQVCASLLRPMIERMRPSNLANPISEYVHVVDNYRGGRFGFPSCHGATTMATVVFLSLYFRRRAVTLSLVAWSLVVCYTRVYLGVHYPGDILVGMLIGSMAALIGYVAYRNLCRIPIPRLRLRLPSVHNA